MYWLYLEAFGKHLYQKALGLAWGTHLSLEEQLRKFTSTEDDSDNELEYYDDDNNEVQTAQDDSDKEFDYYDDNDNEVQTFAKGQSLFGILITWMPRESVSKFQAGIL